jgi:hypothetical protein
MFSNADENIKTAVSKMRHGQVHFYIAMRENIRNSEALTVKAVKNLYSDRHCGKALR